jgi:hypothetical protein
MDDEGKRESEKMAALQQYKAATGRAHKGAAFNILSL